MLRTQVAKPSTARPAAGRLAEESPRRFAATRRPAVQEPPAPPAGGPALRAALARAERLGHHLDDIAVGPRAPEPGGRPLPEELRRRMERSFDADFSRVVVHEDERAGALGAVAYARGEHLHFAPGKFRPGSALGRRLIGHELAHVVQQRAGRVAAPPAAGMPINADPVLEAEADRLGLRAARGDAGGSGAAGAVTTLGPSAAFAARTIQPGFWDWFGLGKNERSRDEEEGHQLQRFGKGGISYSTLTPEPNEDLARRALISRSSDKAGLGLTGASATGSILSKIGAFFGSSEAAAGTAGAIGGAGSAAGSIGSLVELGATAHQLRTGAELKGDKALLGLQAASAGGSAITSAASSAIGIGSALGSNVASAAGAVAGPAALLTGGADIVRGTVGGLAAHKRQRRLEALASRQDEATSGLSRFAAESQRTKKWGHAGTALKGGLALGGGIALLAGAGPLGWGLLGGAALVGAGVAGYKAYRRHKEGAKVLDPESEYAKAGLGVTHEELRNQKWYEKIGTKKMRAQSIARGKAAARLREHRQEGLGSKEVLRLLGLREDADERQIARALEG